MHTLCWQESERESPTHTKFALRGEKSLCAAACCGAPPPSLSGAPPAASTPPHTEMRTGLSPRVLRPTWGVSRLSRSLTNVVNARCHT
eukprot:3531531-Amphidinium_carterae.1